MDLEEDVNLEGDEDEMDGEEETESYENGEPIEEVETDEEGQQFDITLAASHSYMGGDLLGVSGRSVLEGGAAVRLPALAHHGTVFPGETVPMLLNNEHDAAMIAQSLTKDKLFGLLCPDETCTVLSGYGVVCEVFEVALGAPSTADRAGAAPSAGAPPSSVSFKARAVHRFRLKDMPKRALPVALYVRLRHTDVVVLPEVSPAHPLRRARPAATDARRRPHAPATQNEKRKRVVSIKDEKTTSKRPLEVSGPVQREIKRQDILIRRLDAAVTPWPGFVYEIFDYARMRNIIHQYFTTLGLEKLLPSDPVSLSFWVASNLTVAARDRLALFVLDNALLRLHMECRFIGRKSVLCCSTCGTEVARREHGTGMSSDGLHGNYTNPGGFVHDVLTVSAARNTRPAGPPSTEFSWFPGYSWSVCLCACCAQHVGWRFDAVERALRPRRFYALCRNYVVPRDAADRLPPAAPAPPPPRPAAATH